MDSQLSIGVRQLDPDLPLPAYAHPGDAGADLSGYIAVPAVFDDLPGALQI